MANVGDLWLDHAGDPRVTPKAAHDAGYKGFVRYISYDTHGKNLSPRERDELRALKMGILLVWEWGDKDSAQGYNLGVTHGTEAVKQARALSYPVHAIAATSDSDLTPDEVDAYYQGFTKTVTPYSSMIYGGIWLVDAMLRRGRVKYGWQANAWNYTSRVQSMLRDAGYYHGDIDGGWGPQTQAAWGAYGGQIVDGAHIARGACLYQRLKHTRSAPGDYDEDIVLKPDIGAWEYSPPTPPTPAPPPTWKEIAGVKTSYVTVVTDGNGNGQTNLGKVSPISATPATPGDKKYWPEGYTAGLAGNADGTHSVTLVGAPANGHIGVYVSIEA